MQLIKDSKTLAEAISFYENKKKSESGLLKHNFNFTIDSLNPIHILKEKINETIHSPGIKGKIIGAVLNFGTGMFAKNLILGNSINPLKRMAVNLIQSQISKLVDNPPTDIKDKSISFIQESLQKLKIK